MVIQLFGAPGSSCTHLVLLTAAELGILDTIKFTVVNLMNREQKSQEYMAKQPFGQVPYLIDEETGVSMYESRAIARYLVTKAKAGHLMPLPKAEGADQFSYLRELAKSETAASVELSNVYPHRSAIMQELYLKPMRKVEPDQAKVAESRAALSASLDIYDSILSKQAYLTGSEFSLVDLFHIPTLGSLNRVGQIDLLLKRPNVKRWWQSITSRPSHDELAARFPAFKVETGDVA